MDGHLVAVEVGVEGGADQRMQLDRLAFDKNRLEGLNPETMQRRCPVQHHRMLRDHVLEHVPDARLQTLDHLLRALDVVSGPLLDQLLHHEGLEQLDRHLLRKTALINLQLRTDDDDGTA